MDWKDVPYGARWHSWGLEVRKAVRDLYERLECIERWQQAALEPAGVIGHSARRVSILDKNVAKQDERLEKLEGRTRHLEIRCDNARKDRAALLGRIEQLESLNLEERWNTNRIEILEKQVDRLSALEAKDTKTQSSCHCGDAALSEGDGPGRAQAEDARVSPAQFESDDPSESAATQDLGRDAKSRQRLPTFRSDSSRPESAANLEDGPDFSDLELFGGSAGQRACSHLDLSTAGALLGQHNSNLREAYKRGKDDGDQLTFENRSDLMEYLRHSDEEAHNRGYKEGKSWAGLGDHLEFDAEKRGYERGLQEERYMRARGVLKLERGAKKAGKSELLEDLEGLTTQGNWLSPAYGSRQADVCREAIRTFIEKHREPTK